MNIAGRTKGHMLRLSMQKCQIYKMHPKKHVSVIYAQQTENFKNDTGEKPMLHLSIC